MMPDGTTATATSDRASDRAAELRRRLVADLEPVRPVRLRLLCAAALAFQVLFAFSVAALLGMPASALARLADPMFALMIVALAAAAAFSAVIAAKLSVPGRFVSAKAETAAIALPPLLAVAVVCLRPWGADWHGVGAHLSEGLPCTVEIAAIALPAWAITIVMLRRLAPLSTTMVGWVAATTAMLQGALLVQMLCANMEAYHLALSHLLPVTVVALLIAVLSGRLLTANRS